ncbi:MFS transporter [Xylocopilactobacillus apicola]|uniref:MFS transporter n=1 Tax=Xylocopilactobacillus apicola TaxID=2932184 RepID=A0AAU9D3E9_9LACO|nr:MFS transporter [Xylocopilactobacillus apicola]BDR59361.1 MFS transporter [Xylocopilactobacillus apicola]
MKNHKLLIFTLAFGTFSILNTEVGIVGILPVISKHFGIGISGAGLLVSLFALTISISGPIMPVVMGKFKIKRVLLFTLWIFVLSNIISANTNNFTIALIARIIPAIFHPVYCSYALTLASNSVAPKEAPKAVSLVMMGVSSGMVVGTPVTTIIANHFSYASAMYFLAIVSLLSVILNNLFLPKDSQITKITSNEVALRQVIKRKNVWVSGLATISLAAAMSCVYSYVSDYLSQVARFEANQLSSALFIFGLASICGNFIAGFGLSRSPQKFVAIAPIILAMIYILEPVLSQQYIWMFGLIIIWGAIYGIGNNTQQYLISSALPNSLNLANGLFISLGNVGITIGTTIGGLILGKWGIGILPLAGIFLAIFTFFMIIWRNIALV